MAALDFAWITEKSKEVTNKDTYPLARWTTFKGAHSILVTLDLYLYCQVKMDPADIERVCYTSKAVLVHNFTVMPFRPQGEPWGLGSHFRTSELHNLMAQFNHQVHHGRPAKKRGWPDWQREAPSAKRRKAQDQSLPTTDDSWGKLTQETILSYDSSAPPEPGMPSWCG